MKNIYCSYYTNSDPITSYMVERLAVEKDNKVLEPSAGEGIFIDKLIEKGISLNIDALDINSDAINILKNKYADNPSVTVRETDTLLDEKLDQFSSVHIWLKETDTLMDEQLDFFSSQNGYYDRIIGNPPYGAWQDYAKRDILKKKYAGHYVKETYSLFLLRCLSVLKTHGKLSFIIPDTFMFLNMHTKLRRILLANAKIEEILLFPSKFFPGVSFGYSNLSIITLQRASQQEALDNSIRIIKGFRSVEELSLALNENLPKHLSVYNMIQKDILNNPDYRFVLADESTSAILSACNETLEHYADVVTGFYCGDNKKFIRVSSNEVKGSKGYLTIDDSLVVEDTDCNGIDAPEAYVPYVKASPRMRYVREINDWFVRWDKKTIVFYNKDTKARFQNSQYYFRTGIAIPMVKSNTIKATLMENSVFDQSIVGIFPKDKRYTNYILALMNSDVVNKMIHVINPTANNSANYVKMIPFIVPTTIQLEKIDKLTRNVITAVKTGNYDIVNKLHEDINSSISEIYTSKISVVIEQYG